MINTNLINQFAVRALAVRVLSNTNTRTAENVCQTFYTIRTLNVQQRTPDKGGI